MSEILAELTKYPVATRLSLNGTIIVGRDIAHAKIKERLDAGEPMPEYLKNHPEEFEKMRNSYLYRTEYF
jgi:fumarate hydratase class I